MKQRRPTPAPELDPEAKILGAERSPELELAFLFGIAAFAYLAGLATDSFLLRLVAKPWPVIALARWVTLARPRYGIIAAALYAGAVGDVLLEVSDSTFLAGVVAFLVGHLLYLGGLLRETTTLRPERAIPPLLVFVVMVGLLAQEIGTRAVPFAVYGLALAAVVWRAAARIGEPGIDRRLAIYGTLGAASFMVSDAFIAIDRFLGDVPAGRWVIILTYWMGQAGLAASFALGQDPPAVLAPPATLASDHEDDGDPEPGDEDE